MTTEELMALFAGYNGEIIKWLEGVIKQLEEKLAEQKITLKSGQHSQGTDPVTGPPTFPPPYWIDDLRELLAILKTFRDTPVPHR